MQLSQKETEKRNFFFSKKAVFLTENWQFFIWKVKQVEFFSAAGNFFLNILIPI